MRAPTALLAALCLAPLAAAAGETPGLESATLHPGWTRPDGTRVAAIELVLAPGWKTYWRSPGDAGIAPSFDWTGSKNVGDVTFHWPAPEVIDSAGMQTLGFHDRLLLPVEIAPATPGQPMPLTLAVDFGLCREICVPAHVDLTAPDAGDAPDPAIEAALAAVPEPAADPAACEVSATPDGWNLAARVPAPSIATPAAAIELATAEGPAPAWVSSAEVAQDGAALTATAEVIPDARGYAFDPATLRLTLIGDGGAVEFRGCAPA